MHRLIKRQLKRIYGKSFDFDELSEHEKQLIEAASTSYDEYDKELKVYEHTLDVNSKELNEKNKDIRKALSSLSEAQRLAHTGSWFLDLKSDTLEWSNELYRIFNLSPKEIPPDINFIKSLIHPEDREIAIPELTLPDEISTFDQIYRLKFSSGEIKYVHEYRENIYSPNKKAVALHGTMQDVTAQKRAEEELNLYANVFSNSGESILITDKDTRIIAINAAFTKDTGFTLDELKGQTANVLAVKETPRQLYEEMWHDLNTSGFWQGEINGRKKSGRVYPKWMSISVSYSESGEVLHYISSFTDISGKKADQRKINFLAHHDALTGLVNRYSLEERLSQAILNEQRNNSMLALMFIDMDRFKLVNDTFGHQTGDDMLMEVSQRLRNCVRECDIVARIGGDEFVVVLTGIRDSLSAAPIARYIMHTLGEPYRLNNQNIRSSPSIGISIFPTDGTTVDNLMKNADIAMYHAKDLGRNNYQFFSESLNSTANDRLQLENDLRYAIENNQFELHYQPQICTDTWQTCSVEALLRWNHPEKGIINPDEFISTAEDTELIIPLGLWILDEACRQQNEWYKKYGKRLSIAVNVSAQQLKAPDLIDKIKTILHIHQTKPDTVELEVTESTAMSHPDEAISQLHNIRNLGIHLAIDDFGTGYSSLAYLKLLPIDTLKLDRTFVQDLKTDHNNYKICTAALALAHNLGLRVVAEGVETDYQKEFLTQHCCDVLQGYYYSKPLASDAIEKYVFGNQKPIETIGIFG